MKHKLKSLRLRILLPFIILVLAVISLLNALYSRAYINMIQQQEREVNAVGFATVSNSLVSLINASIAEVRSVMADDRVASYARLQYASTAELVHARIRCRDYLQAEISSRDGIYGLLFMRKDGSQFGSLPDGNIFQDRPEENPLPDEMKAKIMNAPLGQTVWVGPVSGVTLYSFENSNTPQNIMIAAWKFVHVSYGECYALMLMDESIFEGLFAAVQDEKSSWYLFAENQAEICHTGQDTVSDPERLIRESNSGVIFRDENNLPAIAFSTTLETPAWTLVRKVSMESYEKMSRDVIRTISIFGGLVLLVALTAYEMWMRRFLRQFYSLLKGIVRMGQGDLESTAFEHTSIDEFQTMQQEINRTRIALNDQMETIRRMEREQMALENKRKEQERIEQELKTAREIQASALPQTFPAFPEQREFALFASMTPAKEVGGDFYDFFLIDSDHLALVIADVSGKGIPAALFMMASKTLIRNEMMVGYDPAAALERVNLQQCEHNPSCMFVTVWLAVVELSTGKGLACNAGHGNPCLRRAGGKFELVEYRHGMPVGGLKKARYQNRAFELHSGDCIFVYTDGVSEAVNAAEDMFGEERMLSTLNEHPDAEPEDLIRYVHDAVTHFADGAPQFDDITMLGYKHYGT